MKIWSLKAQAFFTYVLYFASYVIASPPIKVSLRSSWPETPLLLEILETVSLEDPEAFFPLVDELTDTHIVPTLHTLSNEAIYQLVLETALSSGYLQQPGALALTELQLTLHAAAPKIRAYFQFYSDHGFQADPDCDSWVDWYGERVCDVKTLEQLAGQELIDPTDPSSNASNAHPNRPKVLSFDHINPPPDRTVVTPPRTAILYASLNSPNFRELHSFLFAMSSATQPRLEYILRHKPAINIDVEGKTYLSGYGVTLDLKKTDYLVLDDRHPGTTQESGQRASTSSDTEVNEDLIMSLLQSYPENDTLDATVPLDGDEIFDLGIKSTQFIMDSSYPLLTLLHLSQNFPKYTTSIARRVKISDEVQDEIMSNRMLVPSGGSQVWLNGHIVQEHELNPFGLLRLLRKERNIMQSLVSLGLATSQAIDFISHPIIHEAQSDRGILDGLVDASDRIEGGSVITWWNDLTKDSRYARWAPSLSGLLRPLYPGQFHNVKLNIYNLVLVVDLSHPSSLNFIANAVNNLINRGLPFRIGIVPITENEEGVHFAKLFYHLIENYGRAKTMRFVTLVSQRHDYVHKSSVDWSIVQSVFEAFVNEQLPEKDQENGTISLDLNAIISDTSESLEQRIKQAELYTSRMAADLSSSRVGHAFLNGRHMTMGDDFLRSIQTEVTEQLRYLQEKIYIGEINENDAGRIDTYFYDLPQSSSRRSGYVHVNHQTNNVQLVNLLDVYSRVGFHPPASAFLYPKATGDIPLTAFIVADLDSSPGIALMLEAITNLDFQPLSRLYFIHNPSIDRSGSGSELSNTIVSLSQNGALSKLDADKLKGLFEALLSASEMNVSQKPFIPGLITQFLEDNNLNYEYADSEMMRQQFVIHQLFCREFGIAAGSQALILNGRVIGPIAPYGLKSFDYEQLGLFELRRRVRPVQEALANMTIYSSDFDRATYSNLLSMASSLISSIQQPDPSEQGLFNAMQRPRQRNYKQLQGNHTRFEVGDFSTALYHFGVLLDPVSESAQKWSSLLIWLAKIPFLYMEFYMNPGSYSEIPLKRFYRYNLWESLSFNDNGEENPAMTIFHDLPSEPIYTLGLDVPSSWLVRPREAFHDLDNIQLASLVPDDRNRGVEVIYELDFLVIEGHARESPSNQAPRGLQLQLLGTDLTPIAETLVVVTLGYMQFRAVPGVFSLEIRDGRGRDIFEMESVGNEGWMSPTVGEGGMDVTLTSFEGLTLFPRVRRKPGMERADVLDQFVVKEDEPKSILDTVASRLSSFFKSQGGDKGGDNETNQSVASPQAEINIFTVASGLLYERFVSIMILSVLKNTQSSVKFWFIENFLSPSFLEFIPHFAEAYGFEYELVTYKWPSWLRAQKEKQRVIWGYKILFLDVLFPMDLKRVIFVDADQIVRADLRELVELDLHGAPYGYTPMGDDNPDTEGFRFWKTGYWRDFLQGRPYHISALYVIDLVRFRQLAAGDILRSQYHQLSADPQSLANLDQDLPNNLQRDLPIFSLHEDWLWCETWCSKERLHRAKTIDLCQNPLTKEPKLARARQIPEWEEYDAEVAQFARKLAFSGVLKSSIATIDVNTLAEIGSGGSIVSTAPGDADTSNSADHEGNIKPDQKTHDEL